MAPKDIPCTLPSQTYQGGGGGVRVVVRVGRGKGWEEVRGEDEDEE